MTPQTVMALGQNALELTLLVAAPLLLSALVVGLIVSVFQAATQINEMTLSFIPKLIAIFTASRKTVQARLEREKRKKSEAKGKRTQPAQRKASPFTFEVDH